MLSELIQLLDERAVAAGFTSPEDNILVFADSPYWFGPPLKSQVKYWSTKFASVLLIQIDNQTQEGAWKMTRKAEAFLDASLLQLEQKGAVVDGYLVIALPQLNDDLRQFINEAEKDTRFVRKHVVYYDNGRWQRCQRITPLGLVAPSEMVEISGFLPENQQMAELLNALGENRGKDLARIHGKMWDLNE
ncbi:ABC-three component system middle component 1 [Pantoea dispersa]|uniref:ABC-three component system middle component 1 n=1 Tax=Pantoea dispersa TaxID=59814 RepID=UPI00073F9E15|nr:ABC-three component system middle component 1 [Pantoea dispersa]